VPSGNFFFLQTSQPYPSLGVLNAVSPCLPGHDSMLFLVADDEEAAPGSVDSYGGGEAFGSANTSLYAFSNFSSSSDAICCANWSVNCSVLACFASSFSSSALVAFNSSSIFLYFFICPSFMPHPSSSSRSSLQLALFTGSNCSMLPYSGKSSRKEPIGSSSSP